MVGSISLTSFTYVPLSCTFPFRRDIEKDLELGNHGLDIIRLAGSHINDDVDDCVKKIDARVNAHLVRVESWLERYV